MKATFFFKWECLDIFQVASEKNILRDVGLLSVPRQSTFFYRIDDVCSEKDYRDIGITKMPYWGVGALKS